MKTAKLALFYALLAVPHLWANPTPVGPIGFGKGLNVATIATDIGDDESPDMSNFINDRQGASFKRSGSRRFINQAVSTYAFTSLYRAYASSGATTKKITIGTVGDKIVYSTSDANPQWITAASGLTPNQHWSFVTMNNKVIMTGDKLTDPIKTFDVVTSSINDLFNVAAGSDTVFIRAKYLLQAKNYLLAINCQDITNGTTYYPSRVYYSLLNQPSSMTAQRFIDVRTNDGEELTGGGVMFDYVDLFKPTSIHELSFTALNTPTLGGDQSLRQIVNGFGLVAPRSLQNSGQYYTFLAADGVRMWDGGRRGRLTVGEESAIKSYKIKPIIDDLIRSGTYASAVGSYYKKSEQYYFAYEDPLKFPRGRNNSVLVLNYQTGEWFRFNNWLVECWMTQDSAGDKGEIFYGDSSDGYAYQADVDVRADDARKEISLHSMDNPTQWTGSAQDTTNVKEGTASLKITLDASGTQSSMTYVSVLNVGEWYDKSKITKADKLAFKVFVTTLSNISSLRIDLEVNGVSGAFDTNFTSVTLTPGAFTGGNLAWTTIEIPISSFPIIDAWASISSETVPFANTLTFYGARFVLNGTGLAAVSIDDLRVVEATDNPLNAYRFTKLFNFGTIANKGYRELLLTREKAPEANFFVDIYNDFGQLTRTEEYKARIPKEIFSFAYNASTGVTRLSSIDFSVIESSLTAFRTFNGTADDSYLYMSDRQNDRIVQVSRSSMAVLVSTYGAFGPGTTNFNLIHQSAVDDDNIYLVDMNNQRIKAHAKADYTFLQQTGSLGFGTTNFHQPTAIAVDENNVYVADEGNYRLVKMEKSTFGFVAKSDIDYNTIGDSSLQVDENFLYLAYNKFSDVSVDHQDLILEKRDKSKMGLVNREKVLPQNVTALSTYTILGDIALLGRYIYISFTDDGNLNGSYYIQKRLKSDFSLVKEYKSALSNISVVADGQPYIPMLKTEAKTLHTNGRYIQLKYYDKDALDNNVKLYSQTILLKPEEVKESE